MTAQPIRRAVQRARNGLPGARRSSPGALSSGNIGHGLEIAGMPKAERDRAGRTTDNSLSVCRGSKTSIRANSRAACGSASPWLAPGRPEPPVILMDEPFAAVDAITRMTLQEELIRLAKTTKRTVVFITHSVEEAVFLGDYVVAMTARPGRVLEIVPIPIWASTGPGSA